MKQHDFIKDSDTNGKDSIVIAQAKRRRLDLVARLICLVFAFVFWIYFVNMNDDDVTAEIKVTLDIVGKETLKAETGQMVYGLDTQEVTIVVKGTNRDIKKYSASDYKVRVDVSDISGSGKHTLEVVPVIPEDTGIKLSVESIQPQNVIIYSDYVSTKEVALEVENVEITTPYTLGEITLSTDKVRVSGPKAILDTIQKAKFRISESTPFHTSTTYTGFKLDFCDANGEYVPYDETIITYSTSDIRVEVPIYTQKPASVSVLVDGVALDSEVYLVDPLIATIVGDPTLLLSDDMKSFKIELNVTKEELEAGGVITRVVSASTLPKGITFEDGDSITVNITVIATRSS